MACHAGAVFRQEEAAGGFETLGGGQWFVINRGLRIDENAITAHADICHRHFDFDHRSVLGWNSSRHNFLHRQYLVTSVDASRMIHVCLFGEFGSLA